MRLSRLSMLTLLVGACESPTAPDLPDGAQRFTPPPVYQFWWSMVESCSGRSGSLAGVRWYFVAGDQPIVVDGHRYDAFWYASSNQIVIAEDATLDGALVRHEMLHALLGDGDHSRESFLGRCAGVVVCTGQCLEDAGPAPVPQPSVARVTPDALAIDLVLTPSAPSFAQHGGYFTLTVTARNPASSPAVVVLPSPGDGGALVTFEYRVEGEGLTARSSRRLLDQGAVVFAAGETKRQVFDFHIASGAGPSGNGGLGVGTYQFTGAYGRRWATHPLTITLPP